MPSWHKAAMETEANLQFIFLLHIQHLLTEPSLEQNSYSKYSRLKILWLLSHHFYFSDFMFLYSCSSREPVYSFACLDNLPESIKHYSDTTRKESVYICFFIFPDTEIVQLWNILELKLALNSHSVVICWEGDQVQPATPPGSEILHISWWTLCTFLQIFYTSISIT